MKIKLLTGLSGLRYSYAPGEVMDADDAEAVRLISAGLAEPVRESAVETAAVRTKKG